MLVEAQVKQVAQVEQMNVDPAFHQCASLRLNTQSVETNIDGARRVQALMDCSESYLSQHPEGRSAADAEKLRYNSAVASLTILEAVEKAVAESASQDTAVSAQAKLMDRDYVQRLAIQNSYYIRRAIHYQTVQIYRKVFQELTIEGFKMGDAGEWQRATNARYKSQGIWEFPILATYHDGAFIAVLETMDQAAAPMFVIESYGVVQPTTMIRDRNFDSSGIFSDDCTVSVRADEASFEVPCGEYLTGNHNSKLVKQVKEGIEDRVKAKAS